MHRSLSLVLLSALTFSGLAAANSACVAFDTAWNLLAFGFNGKDYNAGTQDSWSSGQATDITAQGRPPFDGENTTCYLSQFANAIYVLGADKSNPSSVYIYDAGASSWSTQQVTVGSFDPTSFEAILDHDTNLFYALSKGELFSLDMGLLKSANSTPIAWQDDEKLDLGDNYQPVMALAQNHIHFLNVQGLPDGSARIFVIHFAFLQPEPQSYGNFPNAHGQATSFFMNSGVQQEFAFIPDDGSATYVINVETNTTQTLKGPTTKDPLSTYFASTDALVQLSSSGTVSYLPYNANSSSVNSNAVWNVVNKLPTVQSAVSPGGSGNNTNSTGSAVTSTSTASGSGAQTTSSGNSAGKVQVLEWRNIPYLLLGFMILLVF